MEAATGVVRREVARTFASSVGVGGLVQQTRRHRPTVRIAGWSRPEKRVRLSGFPAILRCRGS